MPPAEVVNPVKTIFDEGLALLKREGVDEKNARKIIGSLRKDHGDTAVLAALVDARTTHPSGPTAWLMKTVPAMAKKAAPVNSPRRLDAPAQRDSYGEI